MQSISQSFQSKITQTDFFSRPFACARHEKEGKASIVTKWKAFQSHKQYFETALAAIVTTKWISFVIIAIYFTY